MGAKVGHHTDHHRILQTCFLSETSSPLPSKPRTHHSSKPKKRNQPTEAPITAKPIITITPSHLPKRPTYARAQNQCALFVTPSRSKASHHSQLIHQTGSTMPGELSRMLLGVLLLLGLWCDAVATAGAPGRCTTSTPVKAYAKCIALPTQGATLAWTYDARNATLDAAFTGSFISPSGWVAWGVNNDAPAMAGARVIAAFSDPSTGALLALPFVLSPDVKLQAKPLVSRPLDIPLLASSATLISPARTVRDGASVTIAATIRLSPNRTTLHFVWNRGLYVQGYSPTIHPTDASDLASHATVDILTTATESSPIASAKLQWAHGSLNALSWGLLLPVGAALARYLRPCASAGPAAWFYAHAATQAAGYALGAVGFALGIAMGAASPGVTYKLHRGLGIAAATAGSLQTLAVFFRPKTTNRYRKYWKSYHHLVGYGCVVIGVVNVFQGFEVMGLGASYWKLGYCMALATLIGGCVALEVNAWVVFCRRQQEEKLMRREVEDVVVKDRAAAF